MTERERERERGVMVVCCPLVKLETLGQDLCSFFLSARVCGQKDGDPGYLQHATRPKINVTLSSYVCALVRTCVHL